MRFLSPIFTSFSHQVDRCIFFCSHIFGYALYRLYVVRALQVDRREEYGQSICLCAREVRVTETGHSGLLRHVSSCQPGGYLCRILSRGRPELWGPFDVTERERGGGGRVIGTYWIRHKFRGGEG